MIEALVAVAALAIGTAAVAGLITMVSDAKRKLAFQRRAGELYERFVAEVEDARCDYQGNMMPIANGVDQAFTAPPSTLGTWQKPGCGACACPGIGNTVVTTCGEIRDVVPAMHITWAHAGAQPTQIGAGAPPEYHLLVRVREITNDATKDAADDGYWIREFPVVKPCGFRFEPTNLRGEFPVP